MSNYCPECGGELTYDPALKQYICKSCGLTFTYQQLIEEREKMIERQASALDDLRKKRQKEYLKWWLSKKD
ncbi:MAG: TFIIB-type zinc ribbon-containing protein [Candidatus Bathyarchaeia archaeon]